MRERIRFEKEIDDLGIQYESLVSASANTPIIFIPGGMGSELKVPGRILWPSYEAPIVGLLELREDGTDITREKVTVGDVIRSIKIPIIKYPIHMLTKFFEFFKGQGYQENIDMFSFPYDWRKIF